MEARGDVADAEKAVMLLSAQTAYGLKMTGTLKLILCTASYIIVS